MWFARRAGATPGVVRPPDLTLRNPAAEDYFDFRTGDANVPRDLHKRRLNRFARPPPVP
ncbi:hypothetical protein GCM10011584_04090 [Nocardioides phosphati]|uniref:Uncharacterized protein n=1 Tax=Nocardioides phosphati TaxID=1867775 RepID=A0ABQ2N5A1_9ACTN|nr:hypothetical protein GCM10011584_04090 [Nocardioides phosphati]